MFVFFPSTRVGGCCWAGFGRGNAGLISLLCQVGPFIAAPSEGPALVPPPSSSRPPSCGPPPWASSVEDQPKAKMVGSFFFFHALKDFGFRPPKKNFTNKRVPRSISGRLNHFDTADFFFCLETRRWQENFRKVESSSARARKFDVTSASFVYCSCCFR